MSKTYPKLFDTYAFAKGITLRNRVVMAPMTTWSGNDDGTVSDEEVAYYRRRAKGAGLMLTGCTHVMPDGIGFTGEFASYDDSFTPSLRRLAEAARSGGAPAILQIFHAGNKAVPALVPGGEIVARVLSRLRRDRSTPATLSLEPSAMMKFSTSSLRLARRRAAPSMQVSMVSSCMARTAF